MVQPAFSVNPGRCSGCRLCDLACARAKTGRDDLDGSRIQTVLDPGSDFCGPVVCLHCADPACARLCPTGAVRKGPEGIVEVIQGKCTGCLLCTLACPYGGIRWDGPGGRIVKCDLCGGEPRCIPPCAPEALDLLDHRDEYTWLSAAEDMLSPGLSFCAGCGQELAWRLALKVIGPNAILSVAPGCAGSCGIAGYQDTTGAKVPVFISLLTNSAAMMAGVKRHFQRRGVEVHAVALAGDGGTADAGFQALSGAAERGENIIYICCNNEGYMNTGVQRSGTTPRGAWTTTTPVGRAGRGKVQPAKNVALLMALHGVPYAATLNPAYQRDFIGKVKRAKEIRDGLVYLEVFAPCPVGWKYEAERTVEVAQLAVQTGFFPLWEADHGSFRLSQDLENLRPVGAYLAGLGKYSHLGPEEKRGIQVQVDEHLRLLRKLASSPSLIP